MLEKCGNPVLTVVMSHYLFGFFLDTTSKPDLDVVCSVVLFVYLKVKFNSYFFRQYNHVLYGNRAQAYLKLGHCDQALSDSYRAIVLKPTWPKVID